MHQSKPSPNPCSLKFPHDCAVMCTACHLQDTLARVRDASLRHCLQFGVGLHHAGLAENDRQIVERLFVSQKIQVGGHWVVESLGLLHMPCCSAELCAVKLYDLNFELRLCMAVMHCPRMGE
jgi:hypothetical protein